MGFSPPAWLRRTAGFLLRPAQKRGMFIRHSMDSPLCEWAGLAAVPFRTIVDVGANRGQFARNAMRRWPAAKAYCLEPLPAMALELEKLKASHPNLEVLNLAAGDADGEATLEEHVEHSPSSSLLPTTPEARRLWPFAAQVRKVQVPMARLDTLVASGRIELQPPALLKADVQGFEDRVLRGAEGCLKEFAACLLEVNLDGLYEGQAEFADLVALLAQQGFRYGGNVEQAQSGPTRVLSCDAVFWNSAFLASQGGPGGKAGLPRPAAGGRP